MTTHEHERARFLRLRRLFDRAFDLAPAARQEFLQRETSGDQSLLRELHRMFDSTA